MRRSDDRAEPDAAALEECLNHAEHAIYELGFFDHEVESRALSADLRRAAQALRLALVADAEPAILTRIQLRLETLTRQSAGVIARCEANPASQRPTAPPPPGLDPRALSASEPTASERPTIRPDVSDAAPGALGPASSGPASSGPASSGPASSGPASSGPASGRPAPPAPKSSGVVSRVALRKNG